MASLRCQIIGSVLRFLHFSNLWISAAAFGFAYANARILGFQSSLSMALLAAGLPAAAYGFIRLHDWWTTAPPEFRLLLRPYLPFVLLFAVMGAAAATVVLFRLGWGAHLAALALVGLLVLFYRIGSGGPGRELPGLKLPVLVVAWLMAGAWVPMLLTGNWHWGLLAERTLFIVAVTIPFDLRDLSRDPSRLRTLPMRLGPGRTRWLIAGLLLLSAGLVFIFISAPGAWVFLSGHALAFIGLWVTSRHTREELVPLFFDGALVLPGVLAFLVN
jgi:4-hydroxybenzoate polyprenyltransferase